MKYNRYFYLILFIVLTLLPTTIAQDNTSNLVGFIATNSAINVRDRPSTNGTVISSLPTNMSVTILEQSADGEWLSVELPDGGSGWVSASLVRVMESAIPANLVEITPQNADQLQQITQLVPNISTELIFSPDGRLLATHFWANHIEIFDVRTKILVVRLDSQLSNVSSVRFSPDGTEFAAANWDGTVNIYNTQTWGVRTVLNGHAAGANAVAYHPDGELIATGGNDGLVIIWNGQTGERIHMIEASTQPIGGMVFSPDGTILATRGNFTDGVLRLWDVATGEEIWQKANIAHFVFNPSGDTIIATEDRSYLAIVGIDTETSSETFSISDSGTNGTNLAVNPAGTLIVVGRWRTGTFQIVDMANESIIFSDDSQSRNRQVPMLVAFSPDGRLIVTATDEAVLIWGVHGSE